MISEKEQRKMKKLGSGFYLDLLGGSKIKFGAYGTNKEKLGRAIIGLAKKHGISFHLSSTNSISFIDYLEGISVIQRNKGQFEPAHEWLEKVQGMFPKENLTGPEEEVVVVTAKETEPIKKSEATPMIVKSYKDFYLAVAQKRPSNLEETIVSLHTELIGYKPTQEWVGSKVSFFVKHKLVLMDGTDTVWDDDALEKINKNNYLNGKFTGSKEPVTVVVEEKKTVINEQTVKTVIAKVVNPASFQDSTVLYSDPEVCIAEIPVTPENLRVLKVMPVVINPRCKSVLAKAFEGELKSLYERLGAVQKDIDKVLELTT